MADIWKLKTELNDHYKTKNIINESNTLLDGFHAVEKGISKLVIYLKKISRMKHRDQSYFLKYIKESLRYKE